MLIEPQSRLTRERPDIWRRAVAEATTLTGYSYLPKLPLADGTIYACGRREPTDAEKIERWKRDIENMEKELPEAIRSPDFFIPDWAENIPGEIERTRKEIEDLERRIKESEEPPEPPSLMDPTLPGSARHNRRVRELIEKGQKLSPSVVVPEGAMEWLLHEVGHWLAATPEERLLPNYGAHVEEWGIGAEREWQAWGFEEVILAPWGPSRRFAPSSQRDGAAFLPGFTGPMPRTWTDHAERRIREERVDIAAWRALYGEWIRWNPGSWDSPN